MNSDRFLDLVLEDLRSRHGIHTAILYGSRARGDATATSDYDILGIKKTGKPFRDARFWKGAYLDVFVYPEKKLLKPDSSMLQMHQGKVLFEKNRIGTRFLKKLDRIYQKGPKPLPQDEIQARKAWAFKMLSRAEAGDVEGNFRRIWLLMALLEDYFVCQGKWYLGPKESFKWLKKNRPGIYSLFEAALVPGANLSQLSVLVKNLTEDFS